MSETQTPSNEDFMRDFVALQRKVADISNAAVGGAQFVTGDLIPAFGTTRPGCLLCDGSTILDADWPDLGAYIRANLPAAYIVDGTHVKLPDARGCAIAGADGATFILGTEVGAESVTLTAAQSGLPVHTHPAPTITIGNEGGHTHAYNVPSTTGLTVGGTSLNAGNLTGATTGGGTSHTHSGSSSTIAGNTSVSASSPTSVIQPTLPANIFVKT